MNKTLELKIWRVEHCVIVKVIFMRIRKIDFDYPESDNSNIITIRTLSDPDGGDPKEIIISYYGKDIIKMKRQGFIMYTYVAAHEFDSAEEAQNFVEHLIVAVDVYNYRNKPQKKNDIDEEILSI